MLDYILDYKWVMYVSVFLIMLGVNFLFRGTGKKNKGDAEDEKFGFERRFEDEQKRKKREKAKLLM